MAVIEKWDLTQYDVTEGDGTTSIDIVKKTGTVNTTEAANRTISYIPIHYTAGTSSASGKAAATAEWFANASAKASADFIVDDATIVQYNPDPKNRYCWAVGGNKESTKGGSLYGVAKNANCVSVEICSTNSTGSVKNANDPTWSFTDAALNNAVTLVKYLMDLYGIDADHVIRHYVVNGKCCPGIVGWNADSGDESKWTAFKARIGTSSTTSTSGSTSTTEKKATEDAASGPDASLKGTYTVTAKSGLNIRNGVKDTSIMVAIPYGTKVQCYGCYTLSGGITWMYVTFKYNGIQYTGFGSKQYLEKQ